MSRLQMDVVPALSWTVMRPMTRKALQWLKNASVLTASLLGVAFVTLSIGFTGLNPLDELHQQHKQTVEQKRVREASSAMIPLVKDRKVSKVSVSSRLAQEDSVQPLFGPAAVDSCRSWCSVEPGMSMKLCQQGCGRLSLEEFGRRITVADPSPAADAVQVASRCQIERQSFGIEESRAAWSQRVRNSLEVLDATRMDTQVSFSKAKVGHAQMLRISNFVQLPPDASEADRSIAQQMAEVACLRANLALSEMGRHIAAESMDEISHRYYSEFSTSLHPLVSKRESRLETNAKDIRWSRSLVRG